LEENCSILFLNHIALSVKKYLSIGFICEMFIG